MNEGTLELLQIIADQKAQIQQLKAELNTHYGPITDGIMHVMLPAHINELYKDEKDAEAFVKEYVTKEFLGVIGNQIASCFDKYVHKSWSHVHLCDVYKTSVWLGQPPIISNVFKKPAVFSTIEPYFEDIPF